MGIFNRFPWSEEHQLNLDWILRTLKSLDVRVKNLEDSGGGEGTTDYLDLDNKPQINSVTLTGNKTAEDLGLASVEDVRGIAIPWQHNNRYINTSGATIDPTALISSGNFNCSVVNCVPGNVFTINGQGQSTNTLPWAFIDAANNKILASDDLSAVGEIVIAPAGATKLILNNRKSTNPDNICYYGRDVFGYVDNSVNTLAEETTDRLTNISDGYAFMIQGHTLTDDEKITGRYSISIGADGYPAVTLDTSSPNYRTTYMYPCPKGGKLRVDARNTILGQITFFDVENDLSSVQWQNRNAYNKLEIFEIDCYGNYFTISKNQVNMVIPTIYYKISGEGYQPVTPFTSEETALYDAVLADADENTFIFTCVADTHFNEYQARGYNQRILASNFIKISERLGVDCMIHLGDMFDEGYFTTTNTDHYANELHAKEMIYRYKASKVPFIYTQGHHEMYPLLSSGDGSNTWNYSRPDAFGMLGRHTRQMNLEYHDGSSSYYVDFHLPKIRLIVLDSCSYGANGFSSAVVTWYTQVLNGTPDGYGVVITSHTSVINYGDADINNAASIKSATLDFINDGGQVLCHLHGHYHRDNYNIITDGDNEYPLISIGTESLEAKTAGDALANMDHYTATPTRTAHSYTEYLFDVFCVHRDTGVVKTFRFGAGDSGTYPTLSLQSNQPTNTEVEKNKKIPYAVASDQGSYNAGKFMVVGSDGIVAPVTIPEWQGGNY